jgi:hypothetical protein
MERRFLSYHSVTKSAGHHVLTGQITDLQSEKMLQDPLDMPGCEAHVAVLKYFSTDTIFIEDSFFHFLLLFSYY